MSENYNNNRSVGESALILGFKLTWILVRDTTRLTVFLWHSVLWLLVIFLGWKVSPWLGGAFLALGLGLSAWPKTRAWGFLYHDGRKVVLTVQNILAARHGNEVIRQWGLVSRNDETKYPVFWAENDETAVLQFDAPIDGLSPDRIAKSCNEYRQQINAVRVSSRLVGFPQVVRFFKVDPLDSVVEIDSPRVLDPVKMSVPVALDENGDEFIVAFRETPGVVVGGLPGGGKTAAASMLVAPFSLSDDVSLTVLDAKGGDDWTSYEHLADTFVRESTGYSKIRDALKTLVDEMYDRIDTNLDRLGTSNFWNASIETRRKAGRKFSLIVFDECSGVFDQKGMSKSEKTLSDEVIRLATLLVKLGRSAGMTIIFITQKPTAEALPTAIRDNAGLRVSLKVTARTAEEAILGERGDDPNIVSALSIPGARKGGAVIARDDGSRAAIRFFYWPENDLRDYLAEHGK